MDAVWCDNGSMVSRAKQNEPSSGATVFGLPAAPDAIELRHLRAFVAVAEELNFSRAAARLFITQPALSRTIRSLERLVGCDLLRRSTRHVELTLAGDALLARAQRLTRDLDDAVAAARSVGDGHAERLTRLWEGFSDVTNSAGDVADIRAEVEQLNAQFTPPTDVAISATNAGGVPCLLSTPPEPVGSPIVYFHGGGYVAGSAFGYRHLASALALASRRPVITPEYRLAPENPFPAALEDALRVYLSLVDSGTPAATISVAGDSAGAGLAMSLLLALRSGEHPLPGSALLMCPWIDLSGATQRPPDDTPGVISTAATQRFAQLYLAGHPIDDPLLAPLSTELNGLPRILVQAATGDSLAPEAQLLVERGREAGLDIGLELYPVPTHDFHVFWTFLPEAADALQRGGEYLNP
jgi:acetyl esterase/lipase